MPGTTQITWHDLEYMVRQESLEKLKATIESNPKVLKLTGGYNYIWLPYSTILHLAVGSRRADIVKFLVKEHPELITCSDEDGQTALHTAAVGRFHMGHFCIDANIEMVELLFEHAPQLFNLVEENGNTILHFKVLNKCFKDADYSYELRSLIKFAPQLIHQENKAGYTPLHYAMQDPYELTLGAFLEDPALIDYVDGKGDTLLHMAARYSKVNIFESILDQMFYSPHAKNRDSEEDIFKFMFAGDHDSEDVVKLLYAKNHEGRTPISLAAQYGSEDVVKFLFDGMLAPHIGIKGISDMIYDYLLLIDEKQKTIIYNRLSDDIVAPDAASVNPLVIHASPVQDTADLQVAGGSST